MAIHFECSCGKAYRVPDDKAGKKVRCKVCNSVLVVQSAPGRSVENHAPSADTKAFDAAGGPTDRDAPGERTRTSPQHPSAKPPCPAILGTSWWKVVLVIMVLFFLIRSGDDDDGFWASRSGQWRFGYRADQDSEPLTVSLAVKNGQCEKAEIVIRALGAKHTMAVPAEQVRFEVTSSDEVIVDLGSTDEGSRGVFELQFQGEKISGTISPGNGETYDVTGQFISNPSPEESSVSGNGSGLDELLATRDAILEKMDANGADVGKMALMSVVLNDCLLGGNERRAMLIMNDTPNFWMRLNYKNDIIRFRDMCRESTALKEHLAQREAEWAREEERRDQERRAKQEERERAYAAEKERREAEERAQAEREAAFDRVMQQVATVRRTQEYDAAIKALQDYRRTYPGTRYENDIDISLEQVRAAAGMTQKERVPERKEEHNAEQHKEATGKPFEDGAFLEIEKGPLNPSKTHAFFVSGELVLYQESNRYHYYKLSDSGAERRLTHERADYGKAGIRLLRYIKSDGRSQPSLVRESDLFNAPGKPRIDRPVHIIGPFFISKGDGHIYKLGPGGLKDMKHVGNRWSPP